MTMLLAASAALFALALIAAPAQAIQLAPEDPHSPNAETMTTAYWVMLAVAAVVLVAVQLALLTAIVRFRERRGREPARFAAGRGALRPAIGLLSLVAVAVFVFGVVMTDDAREVEASGPSGLGAAPTAQVGVKGVAPTSLLDEEQPPSDAQPSEPGPLEIDAIAQQWLWRFEYPGGQPGQRTFAYGELVVPVDTAVVLDIRSTDVLHSWWVPALGGQVQAAPGEVAQTWFKADEVGRYPGRSTVFSGTAFPVMRSWVRVVTVPEYQDYIEQLESDLNEAQGIVEQAQEEEQAPAATEEQPDQ
jgi:cytochrome c oxidase subunit 2